MNLENEPTQLSEHSMRKNSKAVYDRLTCYGFARRFTKGKAVADIGWEEIGYGSRLLAETAESVVGLANTPEAVDLASATYSAPNVNYRRVNLPKLPYSEDHFDVVVAFGVVENLEHPEGLMREAKRALKQNGTLVISAFDKQNDYNGSKPTATDGWREMYVPEFRELLEHHFAHVRLYRQGVVAGGFVFPASGETAAPEIESAQLSSTTPSLSTGNPFTHSVIAVCSDAKASRREQPYLMLDRDRYVFDECEERAEDVELLRDEIQRMQETEVQALITTLQFYESRAAKAERGLIHVRNLVHGAKRRLFNSRRQGS